MGKDCVKCDEFQRDRQGRECRYCSWRNVTAPQPPADAATESRPVQRRKAAQKSEPAPTFAAAPPVTGDGVEECLGSCERALSAARVQAGHTLCVQCQSLWDRAVQVGIARGREMGARDENKTCEALALDVADKCEKRRGYCGDDEAAAEEIADKIATRRTEEGTNGQ